MEKTLFIITVAVVTAMNYEELMRPASDKVTEYTVSVEAETVEKAELMAGKIIADDSTKFDKETQYIKIVDAKLASGARPIYKDDNIDYRQLQRALRRYHMWPYATRTVELAIDNCVYKGMTPDAAAKWIYEHPEGIATSPNRDAQGDELTALQMMYAELKRKEGVRFEKMQNPEQKSASESAEKKEPLYPNAGLERYIQQNPEVTKKLADLSKPEQVVTVGNESAKEENDMDDKKLRGWIEECLDCDDKTFEIIYRGVHLKLEVYSYYDERYDGGGNEISVYVKSWRLTDEKEEILGAESYDDGFNDETIEDVLDAFHEAATTEDKNESAKEEENNMENIINETVNAYMEAAEAAATNPVPDFMDAVNNLNEEEAKTMNTEERALLEEQAFHGEVEAINENDRELAKIEKIIVAAGGAFAHLKGKVFVMSDNGGIRCEGDIAIEVARKIWAEAGKIFDSAATTAIRTGLKELFYNNNAKQETAVQSKTDAVENKAPESAVKTKEETTMSNNPYDAIATMQPAFNPYITVRFNVIQGGKKVPQERSITCLSMQDRMKLAAEGKVKPMKLESPTYYTGSLFNGNKKVGTWTWNTVRWAYPSLTLNTADGKKKTYSFNGSDHDKPLDNVSILLMAMVQVIGTVRGVKSTVKYYPRKKANGAPRSVTGTAKPTAQAQVPAVEATPSVEEDVAFFMN